MSEQKVFKKILSNGMTILVRPMTTIPKVSTQLWYNVGSKDEQMGEKGIAHLIEHMIFKGTDKLSESDINDITHKLSGVCNAFTSYDYTGYLFDFPSQNWQESLPIMADCMRNCTFKEDLLTSELKAVIQELKMYKDNYPSTLVENMVSTIFPDHPYHHPIIGYKQDLWSLKRESLVNFYKKHYVPNNATLIVVGDTKPEEVFELAQHHFAQIPADAAYKKEEFYINKDLIAHSVALYREVQQAMILIAFVVPGSRAQKDYILDVLSWIVASGKGSRLYQKLVDELEIVTEVSAFAYDLFDQGLFFIEFQPKRAEDIDAIIDLIHKEIASIVMHGLREKELQRACKKTEADFIDALETNQKQAYAIGKFFLATGDENYIFKYLDHDQNSLESEIYDLLNAYCRPTIAHIGMLLPLPQEEQANLLKLQELSDQEDSRILSRKERTTPVEEAIVAKTIEPQKAGIFHYPKNNACTLSNGLEVLYYDNKNVPDIELILEFKAKYYYDPVELPGLNSFMSALLLEGTQNYTTAQLAQEIESYGMTLTSSAGYITLSMLTPDLKRGLAILEEVLSRSIFDPKAIEKTRQMLLADIKNYWDEPSEFSGQLIRELVYKGHPYGKSKIGSLESIARITREDLINFYKKHVTPQGARVSVVGDLNTYQINTIMEDALGKWQGPSVADLSYPELSPVNFAEIVYPINRDQVVLCFAGLSVDRDSEDYDKLLIFDQIFTGGILGSMSSRLFQLREQSGLFYTIGGSMLANADEQPGMIYIKTIVSMDRLKEAEKLIKKTINEVIDTLTQEEFEQSRNAIINSMVDNFESNRQMAFTFLVLKRFDLPADYFDTRALDFEKFTLDDVKAVAKKYLNTDTLAVFKVGRVSN